MLIHRLDVNDIDGDKAIRTDEGFIIDNPIITRTGVFKYVNDDGSIRLELRHPDDVFKQDSLDSIKGKPVTAQHHGMVDNTNSSGITVGSVLTAGRQDGSSVKAEIVVHDTSMIDAGNKDLSCGYTLELEEEDGVFNGEPYTHRQRNIKYNHLAIVPKGRAGTSRMNLDSYDLDSINLDLKKDKVSMATYRLDSGVDYEVAPEIEAELKKLNQDIASAKAATEAEKARADAAEDAKAKAEASINKAREDAANEVKARLKLEADAKALNVEFKEDATDAEIKIAVIKSVRTNFDATDKAEAYIDAAYDLARQDVNDVNDSVANQRKVMNQDGKPVLSAAQKREQLIKEGKL